MYGKRYIEEIGSYESDPEINTRIRNFFYEQYNKKNLEKLAFIALSRFPELEEGEHITLKELKNKFRELRDAGYNLRPYSKMSKREAIIYLMEIRRDIIMKILRYNPDILTEIRNRNKKAIEDVFFLK
jgi:hypothetical protein